MTIKTPLLVCVIFSVMCGLCSAQSFDERFAEGQKAMDAKEYSKAYDIFSALLKEHPESEKVNSALGQAAFAIGKLSHASMAYERVLMLNPENDWARLELARTLFAMEQYELAKDYFKAVLDREPPELVKQNVEQFMAHIKTRTKRWDFWGRLDLGAFYDDDINFGPDSDLIDTPLGMLQVDADTVSRPAWGFLSALSMSGFYDLAERGGLAMFGNGNYYGTILDHIHSQELTLFRANAGLQYASRRWLLQVPFEYQYLDRGHSKYLTVLGGRVSGLYAFSRTLHVMPVLIAERRNYASLDDRDSTYLALEGTMKRYIGLKRHSLSVAVQGFNEDAREDMYENRGFEINATGEYRLPWQSMVYLRLRYRNAFYQDKTVLESGNRRDMQWQTLVGLNKMILRQWGVDASYQYTDNYSNFDLYDYTRNVVTLSTFITF